MAIGTLSDLKIYDLEYYTGLTEVLVQNTNVFNAASANAINLVPQMVRGHFEKTSFIQQVSSLVARRDPTSTSTATDKKLSMAEHVAVKINRAIGPVAGTFDEWKKVGETPEELSIILGQQAGAAIAADYINTAIKSAVAATKGNTSLTKNYATTTITHNKLLETLALFGDRASRVVAWVFHSDIYFDLVSQSITDKITNVADVSIATGDTDTFGKPVIISDSSDLISLNEPSSGASDTYHVLGLVEDAVQIKQSEERTVIMDVVSGLDNIVGRYQGEYAYNLGLKGYAYKTASGNNPTDATLAASANWTKVVTDNKDCLGVMLNVKKS